MNSEERKMYDFAYTLTNSAGVKLKLVRKTKIIEVREKTSHMDLVTEHDLAIEEYLKREIKERYPDHSILAEESGNEINNDFGGYKWIIDPIDGTVNYYRFGKDYSVSVALYKNDCPVFGLVYDVANGTMFSARHGEGAAINGCSMKEIHEENSKLNKAVVAMSIRTMKELSSKGMDVIEMLSKVQAHRYLGCASLELCKVANGEYDLFISSNVYEWDIAAARVFLEQRGSHIVTKRKDSSISGKLLVIAYRSPEIYKEALEHFPQNIIV